MPEDVVGGAGDAEGGTDDVEGGTGDVEGGSDDVEGGTDDIKGDTDGAVGGVKRTGDTDRSYKKYLNVICVIKGIIMATIIRLHRIVNTYHSFMIAAPAENPSTKGIKEIGALVSRT